MREEEGREGEGRRVQSVSESVSEYDKQPNKAYHSS